MKIFEIIDEARFEKTPVPYHDMAYKLGSEQKLSKLGSGTGGSVYSRYPEDTTVVKIFVNDRGYAEWLKWSLKNQNNKYVPKIIPHPDGSIVKLYKYYKRQGRNQRIGLVNLEKLEPVDSDTFYNLSKEVLEYLDIPARIRVNKEFLKQRVSNYFELLTADDWHVMSLNAEDKNPDLAAVFDFFSRAEYSSKLGLDLNQNNIMRRVSTGQLVFTDPIAS